MLPFFLKWIKWKKDMILIPSIFLVSLLFFAVNHPEYWKETLQTGYRVFIRAFPYYLYARTLSDYDRLERMLPHTGYLITVCAVIGVLVRLYNGGISRYDMSLAYLIMPGTVIGFWTLLRKFTLINCMNVVISLLLLFSMGTRGPVLCVFLYIIYKLMKSIVGKRLKKTQAIMLLITFASFISIGIIILSNSLELVRIASEQGVSSRFFQLIAEKKFFSSAERLSIYDAALKLILQNPLLGTGILADRLGIATIMANDTPSSFLGSYPHIIFLEFIVQYGIIFGTIAAVVLLKIVLKTLCLKKSSYKEVVEIFLFLSIPPLLLSGTYLEQETFYIYCGMVAFNIFHFKMAGYYPT